MVAIWVPNEQVLGRLFKLKSASRLPKLDLSLIKAAVYVQRAMKYKSQEVVGEVLSSLGIKLPPRQAPPKDLESFSTPIVRVLIEALKEAEPLLRFANSDTRRGFEWQLAMVAEAIGKQLSEPARRTASIGQPDEVNYEVPVGSH